MTYAIAEAYIRQNSILSEKLRFYAPSREQAHDHPIESAAVDC